MSGSDHTERVVEFRRHSLKDHQNGVTLGPRGFRLAQLVGEQQLRGRGFTHFGVSPLWRTHQTLVGFELGAGDFRYRHAGGTEPLPFIEIAGQPQAMKLWDGPCRSAEHDGEDMLRAAFLHDLNTVHHVARVAGHTFVRWISSFSYGTRVLVVGHSPFLEMIVLDLFRETLPGLKCCDGFRIRERDGKKYLEIVSTHPDLDASPFRAQVDREFSPA